MTNDQVTKFEYDFINTEQVLEHVVDPYSVINLLASLLKDNGILKISVPNAKYHLRKNNLIMITRNHLERAPHSNILTFSLTPHLDILQKIGI